MPELLWAQGVVCRNFWGRRGGYAGTFVGSRGDMLELLGAQGGAVPELLGAQGRVCRNFCGLRGGYAGTFVGSGGGMPELLWP